MAPPLVSIVIPCYNHARYLPFALASIQRQDWPSLETIVIDDGSIDGSFETARQHSATIVRRQSNQGLSKARNAGLASARGDFVIFLDADDELLPGAVRAGVDALALHPEAGAIAGRCCLMDANGQSLPVVHPVPAGQDLYEELLRSNFIWTPGAAIFRRRAVQSAGQFSTLAPAAADYALSLALARRGMLVVEDRDVVRYRKHDANMSRDAMLMLRSTLAVLSHEARRLPPRYGDALAEGRARWRAFYGEQLVEDIRREWRGARRPMELLRMGLFLFGRCPRLAITHSTRKLTRVVRRLPPSQMEQLRP